MPSCLGLFFYKLSIWSPIIKPASIMECHNGFERRIFGRTSHHGVSQLLQDPEKTGSFNRQSLPNMALFQEFRICRFRNSIVHTDLQILVQFFLQSRVG